MQNFSESLISLGNPLFSSDHSFFMGRLETEMAFTEHGCLLYYIYHYNAGFNKTKKEKLTGQDIGCFRQEKI